MQVLLTLVENVRKIITSVAKNVFYTNKMSKGATNLHNKRLQKAFVGLLVMNLAFATNAFDSVFAASKVVAKKIKITNAYTVMAVGQNADFDFKLTPSKSTDTVKWTSSDESIAKPDKNGKFTAKKMGTVTITATSKSGLQTSQKVLVVSKNGVTSLQSRVDKMLSSKNIKKVTLKNLKTEETYRIANGDYSNKALVINAPFSDVINNGRFKEIVIDDVKNGTYIENASNNRIKVNDKDCAIKVSKDAYIYSIDVNAQDGILTLVNDGKVKKANIEKSGQITVGGSGNLTNLVAKTDATITVGAEANVGTLKVSDQAKKVELKVDGNVKNVTIDKPVEIALTGDAEKVQVTITEDAVGAKVNASVPVSIYTETEIEVSLFEGAEGSKIKVDDDVPEVKVENNSKEEVVVEQGSNTTVTEVTKPEITNPESNDPVPPIILPPIVDENSMESIGFKPASEKVTEDGVEFVLPKTLDQITEVKVIATISNLKITQLINNDTLNQVRNALKADQSTIEKWKSIKNRTFDLNGSIIKVEETEDANTKTVSFMGQTVQVTIHDNATVTVQRGMNSYVLSYKNNNTLVITSNDVKPEHIKNLVDFAVK